MAGLAGFPADRLVTLPIGVPQALFAAPRTRTARPAGPATAAAPLRITSWSGIDPRKGTHLLIDAAARATRRDAIAIELHGAPGEPDYMRELETLGREVRLHFAGRFADADRPRIAASADLTVLPFLSFETHGLVVDEALALGLPVLVSDRGAPKERIGDAGIAFPADDVPALSRLLDRFAADPAALAPLRAGAHGARPLEDHVAALLLHYHALDAA